MWASFALALVAVVPLARGDPFALTASQKAALQAAATRVTLPAGGSCPNEDAEPSDVEKDFAANPYFKYFAYGTYDKDTWRTLDGLEACMRSVKGEGSANADWVKGADLWEAHKLIYEQFGETAAPSMWWKQGWIEHNPVKNSASVLGLGPTESAPMSFMSGEAWEQQPCNAFSNAAFFEVSLQGCSHELSDYGGTWNWRDEIIAAGALMAFGSFAMHGNPGTGFYHEATGSTEANASRDMMYDTAMFDRVSMDVLFWVFFQAIVRGLARDPTDEAGLKRILGLIEDESLAPLGCDNMYCDGRQLVHMYQKALTETPDTWAVIHAYRDYVPDYKTASVGLVLVSIRAIISDELFGSVAMNAYTQICTILVLGLVPGEAEAQQAVVLFCNPGTGWYDAMRDTRFRQVKDIAKSLATLVTILESLIEGMYWQESLVEPSNYLDDYLAKGVVNMSECWRQTHANWHRVAAQMMKELMEFIAVGVYESSTLDITQEGKDQAWGSLNLVVAEFLTFVNALKTMAAANEVNLCRVFKLAKESAVSGNPPIHYQIMPMLDAAGVNEMLGSLLQKNDPILDTDLGVNEHVKDPTGACDYYLRNVKIDEIAGLSRLTMMDLSLNGEYVSSDYENTAVRFNVGIKTCPLDMTMKASAEFVLDGGSLGWACRKTTWRVEADVAVTFAVDAVTAWAEANFQKLFAGDASSLSASVEQVDLDISYLEITRFDISNFPGEAALQSLVNSLMKTRLREKLTETLEKKLLAAFADALEGAMSSAGSKLPFGSERRLASCPAAGQVALDSANRMWLALPLIVMYSLF